jgi:hypothetical protein
MFLSRVGLSIILVAGLLKTVFQEIDWSSYSIEYASDYKYTLYLIAYVFCLYALWDSRSLKRWNTRYSVWIARLAVLGYLCFNGKDFYEAFSTSGINFTRHWYLLLRLLVVLPLTIYLFITPTRHLITKSIEEEPADL